MGFLLMPLLLSLILILFNFWTVYLSALFVFGLLFVNNLLLFVVLCARCFYLLICYVECPELICRSIVPTIFANSSTSWINDGLVYFKGMISPSIYRLVHLTSNQLISFVVLSSSILSIEFDKLVDFMSSTMDFDLFC